MNQHATMHGVSFWKLVPNYFGISPRYIKLELEATYNPQKKKKKSGQDQTLSVDFGSFHDVLSTIDPTKALASPASAIKGSKPKAGNKAPVAATPILDHQQFTIHSESSKPLQSKKAKKKAAYVLYCSLFAVTSLGWILNNGNPIAFSPVTVY